MKVFHSLRWQIQSWHTLLLVLIVGGMLTAFYYYERQVKVHLLDVELWRPVHAVLPAFRVSAEDLGIEPGEGNTRDGFERDPRKMPTARRGKPGPMNPELGRRISEDKVKYENLNFEGEPVIERLEKEGFYIKAWIGSRSVYTSRSAPSVVPIPGGTIGVGPEKPTVSARWNNGNREVIQPTPLGFVLIGVGAERIEAELVGFRNHLILLGLAILSIGYLGGWLIARRALKPIRSMSEAAVQISAGDLSQRIDTSSAVNELSDLSCVLNDSFEKLEDTFNQQVRFTADASHEMRTPLAVILAKTELALGRERSAEKYQEALQTCYDSANHMNLLIESLLELSKVDSGEFQVTKKPGQLSILVEDCVQMVCPLAEQSGIEIQSDLEDVRCAFDEQRMRQVLINLLSNAIKYNTIGGKVFVSMSVKDGKASVTIKDTGLGMSDEDAAHIFQRFYKVDNSRASEKGSTGLGLAICDAIVAAHGGEISVTSKLGEGSVFVVCLPI